MKKIFIPPIIETQKLIGGKLIKIFKEDEVIGTITFENKLIIATKNGVYIYPLKKNKKTKITKKYTDAERRER